MANKRQQLEPEDLNFAIDEVGSKLRRRAAWDQKGMGTMASVHEIMGVLEEELYEFKKAIHEKAPTEDKVQELIDIAVGCIFGIASIRSGRVDW